MSELAVELVLLTTDGAIAGRGPAHRRSTREDARGNVWTEVEATFPATVDARCDAVRIVFAGGLATARAPISPVVDVRVGASVTVRQEFTVEQDVRVVPRE